jgi:hypothetical protein
MPIHDWTRVDAGIFRDFHHAWIAEIKRALNRSILAEGYYALAEQDPAGYGPDVLTLLAPRDTDVPSTSAVPRDGGNVAVAAPRMKPVAETDMALYRHKQSATSVRHVSGDEVVAVVEVVSPGKKYTLRALQAFVDKTAALLDHQIHLLIADLLPRGKRDPQGIHAEIWDAIAGQEYAAPADKPLTLAAYESGLSVRAYVVHAGVGDELIDMPLFLEPGQAVSVPLEATYREAFAAVPRRWQRVLEGPAA